MHLEGLLDLFFLLFSKQHLLDNDGEIGLLQNMDFCRHRVGCFVVVQGDFGLENNLTAVVKFIHIVDCNAGIWLLCSNDGFVDMFAIKAFPAVFWQKGRVYVDDFLRKCLHKAFWNLKQKTCKDNQIQIEALHFLGKFRRVELFFVTILNGMPRFLALSME